MKFKKILAVLLTVATLLTISACNVKKDDTSKEKQKITFVLDWTPNTNHTGLYVAKEKAYFANANIEVDIIQPPEDGAEVLVASGKAQFGISFQEGMAPGLVGEKALPITAVAALIQHNTAGIISRKGEGMDVPRGMEGKKYATWDMPVEKAMIKSVVESDGGDYSKVKMIPSTIDDEVAALKSKSFDAICIYYAWAGIAAQVKGLETDYFSFKDINPVLDCYSPVVIANNDFLKSNPDTVKAFMNALRKGYEDAISEPEVAADILLKADPALSKDLVYASQKWLTSQYKAEVTRWGYIDPTRWNGFYNWLNENKLVENNLPENTGFSNDYLPK